ncbi:membrane protein [Alteromonas gracilis]
MLADLGPLAQWRAGRRVRRLTQLVIGLLLFGGALGLMVRGALGLAPWDVLHTGLIRLLPLSLGQMVILTSFAVLLLWIPLRERPGIGTIANAVLVGLSADVVLALVATPDSWGLRTAYFVLGLLINGIGSALYIGSQFGRGPRDGLMTGLSRVTGRSLQLMRTAVEVSVVLIGLLLGGVAGVGTLLYALGIGPLTQLFLPWFLVELPPQDGSAEEDAPDSAKS